MTSEETKEFKVLAGGTYELTSASKMIAQLIHAFLSEGPPALIAQMETCRQAGIVPGAGFKDLDEQEAYVKAKADILFAALAMEAAVIATEIQDARDDTSHVNVSNLHEVGMSVMTEGERGVCEEHGDPSNLISKASVKVTSDAEMSTENAPDDTPEASASGFGGYL